MKIFSIFFLLLFLAACFSVEVCDWEGTFKFLLKVPHPLKCPFWDEEKGFLYATDEEDRIRKYDVRDFL